MTQPDGFTAAQASNPQTTGEVLADIAEFRPDLRAAVAGNPSAYPSLLEWLRTLGDPAVNAALAARGQQVQQLPTPAPSAPQWAGQSAPGSPMTPPATPGYTSTPSQGGYGAPQQGGYGAPQGGYGAPQQGGYGAPQGGYGTPQSGYGTPQSGYGTPQGGYAMGGGFSGQPQKKPHTALWVSIAALALIALAVGAFFMLKPKDDETPSAHGSNKPTTTTEPTEATPTTDPQPDGPEPAEDVDVFSVVVGDCIETISDDETFSTLPVISCDQPHQAEIYASTELEGTDFPGADVVDTQAQNFCGDEFTSFIGRSSAESALGFIYLLPNEQTWTTIDDREVLCIVEDDAGGVTGSLAGADY